MSQRDSDSDNNEPSETGLFTFVPAPKYTPDEIADVLLDFYRFLTTLHYDAANLKLAPSGGWPNLTTEACGEYDFSSTALAVLRRIPYFTVDEDEEQAEQVHYKSILVDYSSYTSDDFANQWDNREDHEFWTSDGKEASMRDVFCLARGFESGGRSLFLDARSGEITEDVVRVNPLEAVDIKTFFSRLKKKFWFLQLIPCVGRTTIEAEEVRETTNDITQQQVLAQKDEDWETDLDVQYIRQLYRHYGWPDHFEKEKAFKAVEDLMELFCEQRTQLEWF